MKALILATVLSLAGSSLCRAEWAKREIRLDLVMANTSWSVVIRSVHLADDHGSVDVVADLVAPQRPIVGRALTRISDSVVVSVPASPIRFWIAAQEKWHIGNVVHHNQASSCARGLKCEFVLVGDKRLKSILSEANIAIERPGPKHAS